MYKISIFSKVHKLYHTIIKCIIPFSCVKTLFTTQNFCKQEIVYKVIYVQCFGTVMYIAV